MRLLKISVDFVYVLSFGKQFVEYLTIDLRDRLEIKFNAFEAIAIDIVFIDKELNSLIGMQRRWIFNLEIHDILAILKLDLGFKHF